VKKFLPAVLLLIATAVQAQSISPPIIEVKAAKPGKFTKPQFTVSNLVLTPLAVTITPKSMDVRADGTWTRRPLDDGITVKLSETSFKLPAKQDRVVYVDVQCSNYPCNVALVANFGGARTDQGLAVEYHLGAALYLCTTDVNHCRDTFRKQKWNLQPTSASSSSQ
jgi:hypothetical protein